MHGDALVVERRRSPMPVSELRADQRFGAPLQSDHPTSPNDGLEARFGYRQRAVDQARSLCVAEHTLPRRDLRAAWGRPGTLDLLPVSVGGVRLPGAVTARDGDLRPRPLADVSEIGVEHSPLLVVTDRATFLSPTQDRPDHGRGGQAACVMPISAYTLGLKLRRCTADRQPIVRIAVACPGVP